MKWSSVVRNEASRLTPLFLCTQVSALAVNVEMLIVGSMIKALAAATQMSMYYSVSELVPMKMRYIAISIMYIFQLPGTATAPLIANAFVSHPGLGWRGFFYILTGANAASGLCYYFFYHPPNFLDKHGVRASKLEYIKNFDYVGAVLYAAGIVLFLLGISWGGSVYLWKSPAVICGIVIGALCIVAFFCWYVRGESDSNTELAQETFTNIWGAGRVLQSFRNRSSW
jgi:MFS family permease